MKGLPRRLIAPHLGVMLMLLLAGLIYGPGLSGAFLFDDLSNLALLGYYGAIDDWDTLRLYLLSGFSGPTGRPLAHLSFLLDANNWPADPEPFKRTNLLIHLATGLVLFGMLRSVLRVTGRSARLSGWIALLAASIWLLHPFWVSTTLYVVQRMAQLSALFVLAGLWGWVELRRRRAPVLDGTWIFLGAAAIWGCGLLAVLSKENGALLPALVLVLEVTVFAAMTVRQDLPSASRRFRVFRAILLGVPLLLLALFLARSIPALWLGEAGGRSFTPGERLLTEGRILWDYIGNLVLPRPFPGGLFNDDIQVSTGWLTPVSTLLAWAGWGAVLAWALRNRQHAPLLAAAILFFLAGHLLESTVVQLELYFEHRNYLPAALLALPLAAWWVERAPVSRRLRWMIPIALGLLLASMTALRADLWSTPFLQALKWAETNPHSARAQHHLAGFWWESGNLPEARRLNERAIDLAPDGLAWLMADVMYDCAATGPDSDSRKALARVEKALMRVERVDAVGVHQAEQLFNFLAVNQCNGLGDPEARLALVERLASVQGAGMQALLLQRKALLYLELGYPSQAARAFRALINHTGRPGTQLRAAAVMASAGHQRRALALLDSPLPAPQKGQGMPGMEDLRTWYERASGYWQAERRSLRETIEKDLQSRPSTHRDRRLPALPKNAG